MGEEDLEQTFEFLYIAVKSCIVEKSAITLQLEAYYMQEEGYRDFRLDCVKLMTLTQQ